MHEERWSGEFTFVQAADTQLGFMADPSWGGKDADDWSEEILLAERLVRCTNALVPKPKFLCVCGDLVHSLPEGILAPSPAVVKYANDARVKRQNEDFKRIMCGLDEEIPLVCVCGNHDVGDRPTEESLARYRAMYGPDYRAFWCGGVRMIVLNSQLLNDNADAVIEAAAQDTWLESELESITITPAKHALVFQHIPWFLDREDEPQQYFNLSVELREKWLPKMQRAGINAVFCGHYHRNANAWTDDAALELVVTSAVGKQLTAQEVALNKSAGSSGGDFEGYSGSGMRVVTVGEERVHHRFCTFADLEQELQLPPSSNK